MADYFAFAKAPGGTHLIDFLLLLALEIAIIFVLISLGQLGQAYQQAVNVSTVYLGINLLTMLYMAGGYFTRDNPNSFFKPIGIAYTGPFILVAGVVGIVLGAFSTSVGKQWFVSILKSAATTQAASPSIIVQALFNIIIAPFSETYFISGFLTPLAFLIIYAIIKDRMPNYAALILAGLVAIIIPAAILTIFHLVVDASNLSQLPLIFIFFSISDLLTLITGTIVIALMMHFTLNLVVPGITMTPEQAAEFKSRFSMRRIEARLTDFATMSARDIVLYHSTVSSIEKIGVCA